MVTLMLNMLTGRSSQLQLPLYGPRQQHGRDMRWTGPLPGSAFVDDGGDGSAGDDETLWLVVMDQLVFRLYNHPKPAENVSTRMSASTGGWKGRCCCARRCRSSSGETAMCGAL